MRLIGCGRYKVFWFAQRTNKVMKRVLIFNILITDIYFETKAREILK